MTRAFLGAGLKQVASAILADIEPWLPARRIGVATDETSVNSERFARRSFFPGGRMPPSTAGRDACRHILRPALICIAMVCVLNFSRAGTNDFFAQGVTAAQAGNFSDAAAAFEQSAKLRPAFGTFLNLGNVEWQRGHAGAAILAWERAGWIYPFDQRAKQNLKFARTAAQLNAPDLKWHESASLWLPPNVWVWLAGASLWLAVGALTLPRFFRWRKAGWQQWLAALGFGVFLFCLAANAGVVSRTNIGFVLTRNAPLLLAPVKTSEVTTTLAAGEPVRKIKTRGGYHLVQTAYGTGWMEQKNLGLVNGE